MKITYDENGYPLFDGMTSDEWNNQRFNTPEDNTDNTETINDTSSQVEPEEPTKEEQMKKAHPIKENVRQAGRKVARALTPEIFENWFLGSKEDEALLNIYNNTNLKTYDELREDYNNGLISQQELINLTNLRNRVDNIVADDEYRQERNKNLGKGTIDIGSGFIPVGGLRTIGLKAVGKLKPLLGEKLATALIHGAKTGGITGAAMGAGEGLIDKDMNPVTSALQYGSIGAIFGAAFGGAVNKLSNSKTGQFIGKKLDDLAHTEAGKKSGFAELFDKLNQAEAQAVKDLATATTDTQMEAAAKNLSVVQAKQTNITKAQTLLENVQTLMAKAESEQIPDIERFVLESPICNNETKSTIKTLMEHIQKGQEIVPLEDGTYSIKVSKWQDAADVSIDELKAQTGNDGISLMNQAVKDTWTERGWLAEGEELVKTDVKTGKITVNTKVVNRIKDRYLDKWQIDNKVDVEFVDGKINGADATTQTLEYKGKTVKNPETFNRPQDIKKEMNNLLENPQGLMYITGRYKNRFFKKEIPNETITALNKADTKVNNILKTIKNNPSIIKYSNKLEELEAQLNNELRWSGLPDDVVEKYYNRFYDMVKLADKYNDLLELPKSATTKKLNNIKIMVNKNASDLYAVLRSEFEHLRDVAKGEVPTDKHFARYNGMNESEASIPYVKHKADNRAKKDDLDSIIDEIIAEKKAINPEDAKYTTETNLKDIDRKYNFEKEEPDVTEVTPLDQAMTKLTVKDKTGKELAYIKYDDTIFPDTIFIGDMQKSSNEYGAGRAAIAKLMQQYPNKTVSWVAISEGSVKSYKRFVKEYPEFADRIEFKDTINYKDVDNYYKNIYNSSKGVVNETESNSGQLGRRSSQSLSNNDINTSSSNGDISGGYNNRQIREKSQNKGMEHTSSSNGNSQSAEGRITSNTNKSEQGFNERTNTTTSRGSISERQQSLKSVEEANQLLEDDIKINGKPDVRDWKVNLENADVIYAKFLERGVDNVAGIKEAISKGDVEYVNMVVEKQLAAERRMSDLKEQLLNLPETEYKQFEDITNSIFQLQAVSKELASAYGRGLNAQRLVHKVHDIFQLSTMQEMGIEKMADLLSVDIKNLNFTRGTEAAKQELYKALSNEKRYGNLLRDILAAPETKTAFDDYLNNIVINRMTDTGELQALLRNFADPYMRRDIMLMLKNVTDDKLIGKVVANANTRNRFDNKVADYVVHNLLSNSGTTLANVISGGLNTVYFPLIKVLGGIFGGGRAMTKEGIYQFTALGDVIGDAWKLGWQAFKTGEGKLINLSKNIPNEIDADKYKAFYEWGNFGANGDLKQSLHNWFTAMTRTMGASDEFLTQMNYRAVVKAKAMLQAEEIAELAGKKGDYKFIKEKAKQFFNEAFDTTGRPLDVDAYAEARDMVYQTPLSGKYFNFKTKNFTQIKEQSLLMQAGEFATQAVIRVPAFKLFIPFIRTPANIGQMALEHNPLYNLIPPNRAKIFFSNTREGALMRSRTAMGMLSTAVGYTLAMQGLITGSAPLDKKERAALFKTGWKPYSFKVGNNYYSYAKVEPLCTILGFSADCFNILNNHDTNPDLIENGINYIQESLHAIMAATLDKASFMGAMTQVQTIYNAINNTDNTKPEQLMRMLQPLRPLNAAVQSASTFGETEATTPHGFSQVIFDKYFNRGLGDYKRNIWGERQDVYNYLLYTGSKGLDKENIEDKEIMRLAELGWYPTEITAYESDSTVKYKEFRNNETGRSLYDAMCEEMTTIELGGKTLREAVREVIQTDFYNTAVDGIGNEWKGQKGTKTFILGTIFNRYKNAAKHKVIDEQGENFVNKNGLTARQQRMQDRDKREASRLNASLEATLQNIRSFS